MYGVVLRRSTLLLFVACVNLIPAVFGQDEDAREKTETATPPLELVQNGHFEQIDRSGYPVGWRAELGGYAGVVVDLVKGGQARSGSRALRMKSPTYPVLIACFNRPLDVRSVAGRDVVISCFYRTISSPQADVEFVTYGKPFAEEGWNTPYLSTQRHPLEESRDWRLISWRVRCPESACEAIVILRAAGAGTVLFDDVSVRPADASVRMEVAKTGEIVRLPGRREVRVRIVNDTAVDRQARLNLVARGAKPVAKAKRQVTVPLPAGQAKQVALPYDMPADAPHTIELSLEDAREHAIYDTLVARVPALLSGRIIHPAFRGVLLASIPTEDIVVEGEINAAESICSELSLEAELGGAGRVASDGAGITRPNGPRSWRLVLPRKGLLIGRYTLTVIATRGRQVVGSLALELTRAPQVEHETGYDAVGRLYVDGRPVFVNGIYNVTELHDLDRVANQGFNLVVAPAGAAGLRFIKRAQELGLMVVIYSPNAPAKSQGADLNFWEHVIGKYGTLSGIVGWHLLGRPDALLMPASVFRAQQVEMTKLDNHHPTITLLSVPSMFPEYAPWCDIVAIEPQPIPALPVTTVALDLAHARKVVSPGKPVWAAIQAVGRAWLARGGGLERNVSGRPPTGAEHRAMTLLALVHGAQGLLHHGYYFSSTSQRDAYYLPTDASDLWASMKETNAMISAIARPLAEGVYRGDSVTDPVHVGAWDYEGRVYVVAVNAQPHPALTTFEVPGAPVDSLYRLKDQTRVAKTTGGHFADELPAYGARIYVSTPSGGSSKPREAAG